MKKTLFTAVLLCFCTLAFNQTSSLGGVVKDDTGEPLIGATLKLTKDNGTLSGTITDIDGKYTFEAVQPGNYTLEVSYTGYETKRVDKVLVTTGAVQYLDVVLETPDLGCCCCLVHYYYYPPLIDQNPGNTGIIYQANFLRNMY